MIDLRHVGIYVKDLNRMEDFYARVFSMKAVISQVSTSDALIDAIVGKGQTVLISKLITPYGCQSGTGDMIELLQVTDETAALENGPVYLAGRMHVSLGVEDMESTVAAVKENGGAQQTQILQMGKNKCCFCTDPEGNWLELIQRAV